MRVPSFPKVDFRSGIGLRDVEALVPGVDAMRDCIQDSEFHAEKDVILIVYGTVLSVR